MITIAKRKEHWEKLNSHDAWPPVVGETCRITSKGWRYRYPEDRNAVVIDFQYKYSLPGILDQVLVKFVEDGRTRRFTALSTVEVRR